MQEKNVVTAMKELLDEVIPLVDPKKLGKKKAAKITKKAEALQAELDNPQILGDVPRRVINSFEEWEDRVFSVVEFVRPGGTLVQFKIQSVTAAEQRPWKAKQDAIAPIQPQPRSKGDGPDLNDPHYKKEMRVYEEKMTELEDYMLLWILEAGLVDITIPGSNDKEKLEALHGKIAGDWAKIGQDILAISNLNRESLRPF